jgi:glycosyltransferase involved in cell wall biosynthesis
MVQSQKRLIDATKPIVLVPAYNEAKSIAKVLGDLSHLRRKGLVGHIVVVNDGSSDTTAEIAKKRGADAVINLVKNSGKAMAFFEGLSYCFNNIPKTQLQNAKLVMLDADIKGINEAQLKSLIAPLGLGVASKQKLSTPLLKIGMTVGSIKSNNVDFNHNLSGQRAFRLAELKPIVERPQVARRLLGSIEYRRGYGLETFLNYYFTRQPELEEIRNLGVIKPKNKFSFRAAIVPTKISAGIGTIYKERPGRNTIDHKRFLEELWGADIIFADRAKLASDLNERRLKLHNLEVSKAKKRKILAKRMLERKARLAVQNKLVATIAPRPEKFIAFRKK